MTAARMSRSSFDQTLVDLAVARVAIALLRWSHRRATARRLTHDEMDRLRRIAVATEQRPVVSLLVP